MSSPASTLCEQCGLCCDGTLFSFVRVSEDEVAPLQEQGLEVVPRGEKQTLSQRCGALCGTLCRVYAQRPAACRAYECLLYRAVAQGEVDVSEAQALIQHARQLRAQLDASVSSSSPPQGGRPPRAPTSLDALRAERGTLTEEAKERLTALEAFVRRHFLGRSG